MKYPRPIFEAIGSYLDYPPLRRGSPRIGSKLCRLQTRPLHGPLTQVRLRLRQEKTGPSDRGHSGCRTFLEEKVTPLEMRCCSRHTVRIPLTTISNLSTLRKPTQSLPPCPPFPVRRVKNPADQPTLHCTGPLRPLYGLGAPCLPR